MAGPPMAAPARRAAGVEVLDLVHAVPAEAFVVPAAATAHEFKEFKKVRVVRLC